MSAIVEVAANHTVHRQKKLALSRTSCLPSTQVLKDMSRNTCISLVACPQHQQPFGYTTAWHRRRTLSFIYIYITHIYARKYNTNISFLTNCIYPFT